ncbi:hypothetical protein KFK09_022108 [Dendrobium nobile]|uniref:Uncharacterized protein n=1 Tax=Dendrobium nobile TaxID=94219 RepID=A0A8T3ANP9_DENNO|nr:hypothetical protein KFK09_022108 [Dendrobium nobile]
MMIDYRSKFFVKYVKFICARSRNDMVVQILKAEGFSNAGRLMPIYWCYHLFGLTLICQQLFFFFFSHCCILLLAFRGYY